MTASAMEQDDFKTDRVRTRFLLRFPPKRPAPSPKTRPDNAKSTARCNLNDTGFGPATGPEWRFLGEKGDR
jgi:hypothetical protein